MHSNPNNSLNKNNNHNNIATKITSYVNWIKLWILRIVRRFHIFNNTNKPLYNIIHELEVNSNKMSTREQYLLSNFLKFHSKTVGDIMTPRSDIKAIKLPVTIDKLKSIIINNLHTRTPVYENNLDNILGFIYIKDLFTIIANNQDFNLNKILRQPVIAAPSMKLLDLLAIMQKKRINIAIVIDEYGGTDGIVTTEDIIENIFGRIEDEHNPNTQQEFTYEIIDQNTIITSARLEIEKLEKTIGVALKKKEDECNTIGGLILTRIGHIPPIGLIVEITANIKAEIIDATPCILKKIKLTIQSPAKFNVTKT